jgi:hypothetical protein
LAEITPSLVKKLRMETPRGSPKGHQLSALLQRPTAYIGQPGDCFECDVCGAEDLDYSAIGSDFDPRLNI